MGVPRALRSPLLVTSLPVRRARPRRAAARHLVLAPGGRRGRGDGALRGVLGAGPPGAAARRGRRLRVLRGAGRRPGLRDHAGAQLRAGGARRASRPRSVRPAQGCCRPCATSGPRTGGGSSSPPRSQPRPCSWWVFGVPTMRSATRTCSTTNASPSPSRCSRTRRATGPRCASWPPSRPQLLFFLSSSCWACETVAEQIPDWSGPARPDRGLDRLHRGPRRPARDGAPGRRPRVVRRRARRDRDLRCRRPSRRRPARRRRRARRRPGRRTYRRLGLHPGDRGRAGRRSGGPDAGRPLVRDPGTPRHGHGHDHGHHHEHA